MSKTLNVLTTFVVFGVYTHGALEGKVNPRAFCEISVWGESFKDCKAKLVSQTDGAFYRVKQVVDHSKPATVATQPEESVVELEKDVKIAERRLAELDIDNAKTLEEILEIVGG